MVVSEREVRAWCRTLTVHYKFFKVFYHMHLLLLNHWTVKFQKQERRCPAVKGPQEAGREQGLGEGSEGPDRQACARSAQQHCPKAAAREPSTQSATSSVQAGNAEGEISLRIQGIVISAGDQHREAG